MYTAEGQYVGTAYLQERPPHNEVLGPVQPRGPTAGVVIRHGRLVAQWGDIHRADMTFSVAKSFLAILTGIAVGDGLIRDVEEPVLAASERRQELAPYFAGEGNQAITWAHLLQQTSEWSGELWTKPDTVDSNRQTQAGAEVDNSRKGTHRERKAPGQHWEYNDVRVNLLALCLLHVFRRPLPEVLAERVMAPVGASATWNWLAYANAYVDIDGRLLPSVPGGGHWGGGLIINTSDLARFGHLVLNRGKWQGRQLLDSGWLDQMVSPCHLNPHYGYMWWLNTDGNQCDAAPSTSFFAAGAGSNIVWIDRDNDLIVVCRWMAKDKLGPFLTWLTRSIRSDV
ncbi:MAG: serine hydrolase domain-containing protein [Hyphomicrobiaceae bacterium]